MYYTAEQITQLIDDIRRIDLDRIGPALIRIAGADGLTLIAGIRDLQSDAGLAQMDLVFGLPHRNLSEVYNQQYTRSKEALGRLTAHQMTGIQAFIIKGLTSAKYMMDVIASL